MTPAPGQPEAELNAAVVDVADAALDGAVAIQGRTPWQIVRSRIRRDKVTMAALVLCTIFLLLGVSSSLLKKLGIINVQNNPTLVTGVGSMPEGFMGGVSASHPMGLEPGTGRDLLSLIISGLTTSLTVAVLATLISILTGTVLGLIAGFAGGWLDWAISRVMDLILSFPQILMLLSLSIVMTEAMTDVLKLPRGTPAAIGFMVIVLGFFGWPYFARIIRGQVLSLRQREFVEAAQSLGARRVRIYFKELLPHLWAPILVYASLILPQNIAAEASLGFLGVGIQPPDVSFGSILNDSISYSVPDPAYFLFPGVTLSILVLSFNLLGDGLRDALDPKSGRS